MSIKIPVLFTLLMVGACSIAQHKEHLTSQPQSSTVTNCRALFTKTEQTISAAGVKDTQAHRLADHPYLRINRFLSSYQKEIRSKQFEFWLLQLQQLAITGWEIELQNLPAKFREKLKNQANRVFQETPVLKALEACSKIMFREIMEDPVRQEAIRSQATVPPEYQIWKQVAGLYPLTSIVFRFGIYRWHQQTLQTFRQPLDKLPVTGRLLRYGPSLAVQPLNQEEVAKIIKLSSVNSLQIPLPQPEQQKRLFDSFAPVFEIDVETNNDKMGRPVFNNTELPQIDTSKPVVYQHLSHTRMGTQTLLQLNYSIWFPARPKPSVVDLLGGHLDGIIWRVTLAKDGSPIMFDSIHHCGCYHLFFPTHQDPMVSKKTLFDEPAFTPQPAIDISSDQSIVIRIGSSSHYIQRVYSTLEPKIQQYYQLDDYDNLRSLPLTNGQRHSMFGQDGIVAGSERGERYFFWPMGVPDPGAMRQWGHHATAFVGQRHFDDSHLLENSFTRSLSENRKPTAEKLILARFPDFFR